MRKTPIHYGGRPNSPFDSTVSRAASRAMPLAIGPRCSTLSGPGPPAAALTSPGTRLTGSKLLTALFHLTWRCQNHRVKGSPALTYGHATSYRCTDGHRRGRHQAEEDRRVRRPRELGPRQVSVAKMTSPSGWQEPGQRPEFEEITVVLRGMVRVEHEGGALEVRAGQAVSPRRANGSATARRRRTARSTCASAFRRFHRRPCTATELAFTASRERCLFPSAVHRAGSAVAMPASTHSGTLAF